MSASPLRAGRRRGAGMAVLCAAAVLAGTGCGGDGGGSTRAGRTAKAGDPFALPPESAADRRAAAEALAAQRGAPAKRRPTAKRAAAAPSAGDAPAGGALLSPADVRSFQALERQLGGSSGVAVAPIGSGGEASAAGSLRSGVAWSSIKPAIATAVAEADGGTLSAAHRGLAVRAITASDNAAATQLWSSLGSPAQAGKAVEQVMEQAGSPGVTVSTTASRAGFTPFGQTEWSLEDQARFAGGLGCVAAAATPLQLMGQVQGDQRWGLGTLAGAPRFKGGWGPGAGGGYLVRQLGQVQVPGGKVGVAVATLPADGAFGTGTQNLTRLAGWVRAHVKAPAASGC